MKSLEEIFRSNLIRLRAGRTQAAIAELADIPLRTYQNVEVNGAIPQGANRVAIASALGVPESHLFVDLSEFVPNEGLGPKDALRILAEFIDKTAVVAHVQRPEDDKLRELLTVVDKRPDVLAHLVDVAHAFIGKPAVQKSKRRG